MKKPVSRTVYYRAGNVLFEWDSRKAAANARKHGVGFELAAEAFLDLFNITIFDREHSTDEDGT